ncbi:MAG: Ig-like domain-containing protein [Parcubacteria group bacterium]|nr:Ig-like domain-containing protein [Parcubacteria group bacterium]
MSLKRDSGKKNLIKRLIILSIIAGSFFIAARSVVAQAPSDLAGIRPLEQTGLQSEQDIRVTIARIIRIILGFLGTLAVLLVLYGGFVYMTAGGDAEKITRAKAILRNALIGLGIILSAFGIVSFIIRALTEAAGVGAVPFGRGPGGGLGVVLPRDVIESHYPSVDAKNIPRNTKIIVTFREKIDPLTIIDNKGTEDNLNDDRITKNIKIRKSSEEAVLPENEVIARAAPDGRTFVFDPVPLLGDSRAPTLYKVNLGSAVKNLRGEPVFGNLGFYEWEFEVSTVVDLIPPQVLNVIPRRVDPPDEPATYARNIVVQVTFNEAMDPTSASGIVTAVAGDDSKLNNFKNIQIFELDSNKARHYVQGTFVISNLYRTVEFITNDKCGVNSCGQDVFCLPGNKTLTADVLAASLSESPPEALGFPYDGVVDVAGNSLDGNSNGAAEGPAKDNYTWMFKTSNTIDLSPPAVEAVNPARYAMNVPVTAKVIALFNKPLLYKTLNKDSVWINDIFYWVTAESVNKDQKTNVFIEHSALAEDFVYNPEMRSGINDLYQNCYNPCTGP